MADALYWTGSGHMDLDAPTPDCFRLADVARNLSRLASFNGATRRFYSVAEHSLLCAGLAQTLGESREVQLWCLMHDAAEAFTGDVVRPVRRRLGGMRELERDVWRAIAARWGLPERLPPAVWRIDDLALAAEKAALLDDPTHWAGLPPAPLGVSIPLSAPDMDELAAFFAQAAADLGLHDLAERAA